MAVAVEGTERDWSLYLQAVINRAANIRRGSAVLRAAVEPCMVNRLSSSLSSSCPSLFEIAESQLISNDKQNTEANEEVSDEVSLI